MLWADFYEGFWDWADATKCINIASLEDIGTGEEVVEVIYEIEDPEVRSQLIRTSIKLGSKYTFEDFQNLEDELSNDIYQELGKYAGFDADNPSYDKTDTSWLHFYDNSYNWDPKTQVAAAGKLNQLGKRDEIVDAILNLDNPEARSILIRKAMASKVKFNHEDFENLQDEFPIEVYRELAAYTGFSAECPDYDKNNHTWKYFYENGSGWTEELQLAAIGALKTFGSQKQVMEVILELDSDAPKRALVELAIKKNIVFNRESLQLLDGSLPDDLFAKLLSMAGIPEDDLYFDETTMTWDDFYGSYSDWDDNLLRRRIQKLKSFGPSEEVAEVISNMPNRELEDLLRNKAERHGVKFTDADELAMGNLGTIITKAINEFCEMDLSDIAPPGAPLFGLPMKGVIPGMEHEVVDLTLLNIENGGSRALISYSETYGDGTQKMCRREARKLSGLSSYKTVVAAECWGKVYCGWIKTDVRFLFAVRYQDGSAQLIQTREGSGTAMKLLQLCEDIANGHVQPPSPGPKLTAEPAQPYKLGKNELPQGEYLIGRDIPAGTYDFFVIYGFGGAFNIAKYDSSNKVINGTWNYYNVGLKEDYEKRELIHIQCKEGYTIKITGSVVLKIARSQKVQIDL